MMIDTNLTFSPQVCDFAVGSVFGVGAVAFYILDVIIKFAIIFLAFYVIKRVTNIWILKGNKKLNKKAKEKSEKDKELEGDTWY